MAEPVSGPASSAAGSGPPRTRTVIVSSVVAVVVAALVATLVIQAFYLVGGDLARAGLGARLFLGLSFVALLVGLFAVFDLVYLLSAKQHLVFRPIGPEAQRTHSPWFQLVARFGPVITVALGILAGYTVFT